MNQQSELSSRIASLVRAAVVAIGISLIALYAYARYISPTARETAGSAVLLILLAAVLAGLVALNLIYFNFKMKPTHPGLARTLPRFFALGNVFLMFFVLLLNYRFSPRQVVFYLLASLAIFSALNVFVYFRFGKTPRPS